MIISNKFSFFRVLQSIALENVIPAIGILGKGRGPNKVPLYAMGESKHFQFENEHFLNLINNIFICSHIKQVWWQP